MDVGTILGRGRDRDWQTLDPDSVDPIRFAVVGIGEFTLSYALPAMEQSDLCTPTLLVSGDDAKAERVAEDLESDAAGLTYDEFLSGDAADAYDAVYIVTPNGRHLEFAEIAAQSGNAVLTEKPMEASSERSQQMVDVCDDADVTLMVAYRMHTVPLIRRARELVQHGVLGDPVAVDGRISFPLVPDPPYPTGRPAEWRLDRDLAGGGALFDIGIYPLNTARFLLDEDPIGVRGHVDHPHTAYDEVEGSVWYELQFPDEVLASGFASYTGQTMSSYTVTGTEGTMHISEPVFQRRDPQLELLIGDDHYDLAFEGTSHMLEEFDYFSQQVMLDEPVYADGEHGLVDMALMEAIYADADADRWTEV